MERLGPRRADRRRHGLLHPRRPHRPPGLRDERQRGESLDRHLHPLRRRACLDQRFVGLPPQATRSTPPVVNPYKAVNAHSQAIDFPAPETPVQRGHFPAPGPYRPSSARGFGPPVAQSSSSTVWTTGTPVPDPICSMQPIFPAAITCGPAASSVATFRRFNSPLISG